MYGTNPYQSYPYGNSYGMQGNYMQRAYNAQPQQMPQAQPQVHPQMQMLYEIPIQDVRFVTSEEAKAYIVMPNSKALLIDKNGGIAHLKTADNMGQSQTQYFRFEPVNADGTPIKPQEAKSEINFDDFIKKNQLANLGFVTLEEHRKVLADLEAIKKALAPKPQVTKGGTQ